MVSRLLRSRTGASPLTTEKSHHHRKPSSPKSPHHHRKPSPQKVPSPQGALTTEKSHHHREPSSPKSPHHHRKPHHGQALSCSDVSSRYIVVRGLAPVGWRSRPRAVIEGNQVYRVQWFHDCCAAERGQAPSPQKVPSPQGALTTEKSHHHREPSSPKSPHHRRKPSPQKSPVITEEPGHHRKPSSQKSPITTGSPRYKQVARS
ncbi:hypothetical protein PS645_05301 [Pseudomonas fluorescens]|uniref:Uncharacterized protein n=1 Tax=Pseudomonas fluorescens TaxID=294 RepID=A0A5E6XEF8_PSEFL|nr:hypothetical protein PS645_05301 [Pseudomonas fluorescens]